MLTEHRGHGIEKDTVIIAENQAGYNELLSGSLSHPSAPPLPTAGSRMLTRVPPVCGDCTSREPPQPLRRDVTTERPRDPLPAGPWPKPGPSSATSMTGPC